MAWIYLLIAGMLEIGWAVGLKHTHGFTRLGPSIFTILTMIASFYMLALAVRSIPIGTGYAVWTGIGAVGVAAIGMVAFGEPLTWPRVLCLALVIGGIVGLKLTTAEPPREQVATERAPMAGTQSTEGTDPREAGSDPRSDDPQP